MPDQQKSTHQAASASESKAPAKATLAPAGESGDPAVHKLLADLETARSNGDGDGVADAKKHLADLGFSAG
jgi:hypothetical protein